LTEFLARNLLAGVSHIWLIDDNRAQDNIDMNITVLTEPFVRLGLVSVLISPHRGIETMKQKDKTEFIEETRKKMEPLCRWASVTDSDEVWYPLDPKQERALVHLHQGNKSIPEGSYDADTDHSGVGMLSGLLEELEEEYNGPWQAPDGGIELPEDPASWNYTVLRFGWSETDNEMRMLRGRSSLMRDYPRTCYYNWHFKFWIRLDLPIKLLGDHTLSLTGKYALKYRDFKDSQHMWMVHYQMKSIEEFLVKMEQAFDRWKRSLTTAHRKCNHQRRNSRYKTKLAKGSPQTIPYATKYLNIVDSILDQWPISPNLAYVATTDATTIMWNGTADWELYMYMKWAVAAGYEWADPLYLTHNNLSLSNYDDSLHHFLSFGFYHGAAGCFKKPNGKPFCVSKRFSK
jgi:hypothetical protein